jgi:hypothetical protein
VPLSDAARALMAGQQPAMPGMQAPKVAAAERTHNKDGSVVTDEQRGFRERAAQEDARFRLATDSEFWLAFCFRKAASRDLFVQRYKLTYQGTGRYVPGPELAAAVGSRPPLSAKARVARMLAIRGARATDRTSDLSGERPRDLLAGHEMTSDLAGDCAREMATILAAMRGPKPRTADVLDSEYWFAAYWASREDKEAFLETTGLDALGDKYLDGDAADKILAQV